MNFYTLLKSRFRSLSPSRQLLLLALNCLSAGFFVMALDVLFSDRLITAKWAAPALVGMGLIGLALALLAWRFERRASNAEQP